jgi:hypothetical protein
VNSAISSFECAWSQYTGAAAHQSDEIINASGNNWWRAMGWRQHYGDDQTLGTSGCNSTYAFYVPLHQTRFLAGEAERRLTEFGESPLPT